MLSEGTIFVNHASGFVKIYNQVSLGAADTVRSKERYEHQTAEVGLKIKEYLGDNMLYKCILFTEAVEKRHQSISFSGVGDYGKNSVAERAIQTIVSLSRTMMLHQDLHWPEHLT